MLALNAAISKSQCKVKKRKTGLEILGVFLHERITSGLGRYIVFNSASEIGIAVWTAYPAGHLPPATICQA